MPEEKEQGIKGLILRRSGNLAFNRQKDYKIFYISRK
jgi:hypothetical protein